MKKSSIVGACVMAGLILLSIPVGVHTSLTDLRDEAEGSYYYDQTGYAIYQGLEAREATGNNLVTIEDSYKRQNQELSRLIGELA